MNDSQAPNVVTPVPESVVNSAIEGGGSPFFRGIFRFVRCRSIRVSASLMIVRDRGYQTLITLNANGIDSSFGRHIRATCRIVRHFPQYDIGDVFLRLPRNLGVEFGHAGGALHVSSGREQCCLLARPQFVVRYEPRCSIRAVPFHCAFFRTVVS